MSEIDYNRLINDPVYFTEKCAGIKLNMMYQRQYDLLIQTRKPSMLRKGLRRNKG